MDSIPPGKNIHHIPFLGIGISKRIGLDSESNYIPFDLDNFQVHSVVDASDSQDFGDPIGGGIQTPFQSEIAIQGF